MEFNLNAYNSLKTVNEKLAFIYVHVKQDHITLAQFRELIKELKQ